MSTQGPADAADPPVAAPAPEPGGTARVPTAPASRVPVPAAGAPAAPALPVLHCENCGASVPGRFCGNCGQRLEAPVHTLSHFIAVAAEDLTHADSRLWRTLGALLGKPGFLTREFFHGRRARYLPPVRLYLVLSVAFFLWIAAGHNSGDTRLVFVKPDSRGTLAEARQAATLARSAAAHPAYSGTVFEGDKEHCKLIDYQGPWKSTLQPWFQSSCESAARDQGRSLKLSFQHNLPRALFVFLPLLAAVMMLLYWHPRHYYVEHLLFCVHNHAFAFLVLLFAGVLSALLPFADTLVGWVTALYVAWYLYRSMRVMYGQGRVRTVAKLLFLSFVYLVAGSLMVGLTGLYSFLFS